MFHNNENSDDNAFLMLNDRVPLSVLQENLNTQSLATHYKVLESYVISFVQEFQLNARHTKIGGLEDWSACFRYGKRFAEISLLVLPYHGYYKSTLYKQERTRNFVLCFMITDILVHIIMPKVCEYNCVIKGSCREKAVIDEDNGRNMASEAQYLYDVSRMAPNFSAVLDGGFRSTSGGICDSMTAVKELGCMKGNAVADGVYDTVLSLCQDKRSGFTRAASNQTAFDDFSEPSITTNQLEIYTAQRDELLARARVELADDQIFVKLTQCIDKFNNFRENENDISCKTDKRLFLKKSVSEYASIGEAPYKDLMSSSKKGHRRRGSSSLSHALNTTKSKGRTSSNRLNETTSLLLPVETQWQIALEDFEECIERDVVVVHYLGTYQGKLVDKNHRTSVNGCTVIAPMLAARYLSNETYSALSDTDIERIIDHDSLGILHEIRSKLCLSNDALIIPSDSHDHLIDLSILSQEMFVGVCGGSVLNDEHIDRFVDMIIGENDDQKYKKIAAAFFFYEHVICITKIVSSCGSLSFNLIDSMPYETSEGSSEKDDAGLRITCTTIRSLQITLRWYFLSKFTDDDKDFIDNNQWCEQNCVTDPRVFQAFVWMNTSNEV